MFTRLRLWSNFSAAELASRASLALLGVVPRKQRCHFHHAHDAVTGTLAHAPLPLTPRFDSPSALAVNR